MRRVVSSKGETVSFDCCPVGDRKMWISLFAITIAVSICLCVAAMIVPSNQPS
jgi:hypothetical protein